MRKEETRWDETRQNKKICDETREETRRNNWYRD